jgi:gliding motility-associated lipoprotein GldH
MISGRKLSILINLLIFIGLFSCSEKDKKIFSHNFQQEKWPANQELVFRIQNKTPKTSYQTYYQICYNSFYPFQNLWLKYRIENPEGRVLSEAKRNVDLFDGISGKPEGVFGAGKIYLYARFPEKFSLEGTGTYTIRVWQYMRPDTLEGVLSAGLVLVPGP